MFDKPTKSVSATPNTFAIAESSKSLTILTPFSVRTNNWINYMMQGMLNFGH